MTTIKIGNQTFNSYENYEAAYVKRWEQLHDITLVPDLNWVRQNWEMRLNNPELYK